MGRRAKYWSLAEKQAARRAQQRSYARTSNYRARKQRSSQNHTAYMKRIADSELIKPSLPSVLPLALIALAVAPLPDSPLFRQALYDAEALDESELRHWDNDPPYLQPEPANTVEEGRFTKNLVDVMLGHRLHLENEARQYRACRHAAGGGGELATELHTIATKTFREWVHLHSILPNCKARRHRELAESLLQWRARIVYSYGNEVKQLERGGNPYR
ncbi:hypothetical protein BU15DRAFT_68209 [Melanogaster broomeanus]|nr:hypothetical protein BU15DRAFT_68209 [Melanogaster broomeanus]